MLFELINTLTIFQKIINEMLNEYLNVFVTIYLNDIFIYSDIKKEHEIHVKKVLQKLKEAKLRVKLKKLRFYTQEVKFLKYIVRHEQIEMNEEKTKTVKE